MRMLGYVLEKQTKYGYTNLQIEVDKMWNVSYHKDTGSSY